MHICGTPFYENIAFFKETYLENMTAINQYLQIVLWYFLHFLSSCSFALHFLESVCFFLLILSELIQPIQFAQSKSSWNIVLQAVSGWSSICRRKPSSYIFISHFCSVLVVFKISPLLFPKLVYLLSCAKTDSCSISNNLCLVSILENTER